MRKFVGYFVWKITILLKKIIFLPILGGRGGGAPGADPPLDPPLHLICILTETTKIYEDKFVGLKKSKNDISIFHIWSWQTDVYNEIVISTIFSILYAFQGYCKITFNNLFPIIVKSWIKPKRVAIGTLFVYIQFFWSNISNITMYFDHVIWHCNALYFCMKNVTLVCRNIQLSQW